MVNQTPNPRKSLEGEKKSLTGEFDIKTLLSIVSLVWFEIQGAGLLILCTKHHCHW